MDLFVELSKPVGHLVINYSEGRLREAALLQAINMKLQLLVIACLIVLSSALAAKGPSRLESGLSHSSRINNFGLTARDDDFYICFKKSNLLLAPQYLTFSISLIPLSQQSSHTPLPLSLLSQHLHFHSTSSTTTAPPPLPQHLLHFHSNSLSFTFKGLHEPSSYN
ncbi:hypothetical protein FHG87_019768 [Trinorchestia longiramus]|nr:hypothetical protein FHG87_019768 [Trinorchestia longiramus]